MVIKSNKPNINDVFVSSPSVDNYQGLNYVIGVESKEPHNTPHFHVYKRYTHLATLDFDGNIVKNTVNDLQPDQARKVQDWLKKNKSICIRDWNELNPDLVVK